MTIDDHTPPVTYRELARIRGYRFGDDGSVWSRRISGSSKTLGTQWNRITPRRHRHRSGHLKIHVGIEGKYVSFFIHRLILEAFVGPCPEGLQCCHNDGDPANNRLENLRWDTPKSNAADGVRDGVYGKSRGSARPQSKVTEVDIPMIRRLHAEGMGYRKIGERYGIDQKTVYSIVTRQRWAHIP